MEPGPPAAPFELGVVILGAGASRRMGSPKLLLAWQNTTVIGRQVDLWRQLGARQIAVILAKSNSDLIRELDRIGVPTADRIINPDPERGMFSSIQCAAGWDGWNPPITHVAIGLGDQPHLQRKTLDRLIELARSKPHQICQPHYQARPKHPVILPRNRFMALGSTTAKTLKEFLRAQPEIASFASDDAGLDLDIDRPEDYAAALAAAVTSRVELSQKNLKFEMGILKNEDT